MPPEGGRCYCRGGLTVATVPPDAPSQPTLTRYWAPLDSAVSLDDAGFLHEPGTWFALRRVEHFQTLPELEEQPCVVLLGESGMGKTVELRAEEDRLRSAGRAVAWRRFASYGRGRVPIERMLEGADIDAWRSAGATLHLLLDAIDEAVETPERTADLLAGLLRAQTGDLSRLRLRITGRSAVWTDSMREALRGIWGQTTELVLQPLRRSQVERVLAARGLRDAPKVVQALVEKGLGPLAARPITLFLLAGQLASDGGALNRWRTAELYKGEFHRRRYESLPGDLSPAARLERARGLDPMLHTLGAMTVLGDCAAFSDAPTLGVERAAQDALLSRGDSEVAYVDALHHGELVREGELFRWQHPSFAEYHAARWIEGRVGSVEDKLRWLVGEADGSLDALPAPVGSAAGWLAEMDDAVFQRLLDLAPLVLVRCDRAIFDDAKRARLVSALLRQADRVRTGWGGDVWALRDLGGLPEVDAVLRACASDVRRPQQERYLALWIAWLGTACSLTDVALSIALARIESAELRRLAIRVLQDHGDAATRRRLLGLPELADEGNTGAAVELRRLAVEALWRRTREDEAPVGIEQLIEQVKPGASDDRWYEFVTWKLAPCLRDGELAVAVRWAKRELSAEPDRWRSFDRRMFDAVIERAWEAATQPPVADAMAEFFLACEDSGDLFRAVRGQTEPRDLAAVQAVARAITARSAEDDKRLTFRLETLLARTPWTWCLEQARVDVAHAVMWAALTLRRVRSLLEGWREPLSAEEYEAHTRTLDAFEEACRTCPPLKDVSRWYFEEGVALDEPWVRFEREHQARKRRDEQEQQDTRSKLASQVQGHFDRLEAEPGERFWQFAHWIRATPQHGGRYNVEHRKTIQESAWWEAASAQDRARVLEAARRYLEVGPSHAEEWFGQNVWDHRAEAGFLAMLLLAAIQPDTLGRLAANVWARWMPALISFQTIQEGHTKEAEALLRRAAEFAPGSFAEWIDREIDREVKAHGNVFVLRRVPEISAALAERLRARLGDSLPSYALSTLLERLHECFPEACEDRAMQILRERTHYDDSGKDPRLGAAVFLMQRMGARGWDAVWSLVREDTDFGRALVQHAVWPDSQHSPWRFDERPPEALREFWEWLLAQWPYTERYGVHEVIAGEEVRRAVLDALRRRALRSDDGDEALAALRAMAAAHPELGVRHVVADTEHAIKARRWRPWPLERIAHGA